MKRQILVVLVLVVVLGADEPKQKKTKPVPVQKPADAKAVSKDQEYLQGSWRLESLEKNGKPAVREEIQSRTIFFGGDKFVMEHQGKLHQAGIFVIQPTKSPKGVNFSIAAGERKDTAMLGIYQLQGDTLKFCIDTQGYERPKEFKTVDGSDCFVAVYKRTASPGPKDVAITGRYKSAAVGQNGQKLSVDVDIERRGDSYTVRWGVGSANAYVGVGIRKGDQLSVAWLSTGTVGVAVYRIEKGPRLVGDWTELGGLGALKEEILTREDDGPKPAPGQPERKADRDDRSGGADVYLIY